MDQSKKTMRHFYCRDVLWETFEQMASDFDCSIDYLINEAMRYYARSKNYQAAPGPQQAAQGTPGYPANPQVPPAGAPAAPPSARRSVPPPPPAGTQQPRRPAPTTMPRPAGAGGYGGGYPGQGHHPPVPGHQPSAPPQASVPAQAPPAPRQSPASQPPVGAPPLQEQGAPVLYLIYNNQRYPISHEQFVIGRGSKTADLPIKDGNISRRHAAVIKRNGTYYIKDLGSTNGIDYRGMRIDNKRIDEGDVFHLCDYELRFTYRPD